MPDSDSDYALQIAQDDLKRMRAEVAKRLEQWSALLKVGQAALDVDQFLWSEGDPLNSPAGKLHAALDAAKEGGCFE